MRVVCYSGFWVYNKGSPLFGNNSFCDLWTFVLRFGNKVFMVCTDRNGCFLRVFHEKGFFGIRLVARICYKFTRI